MPRHPQRKESFRELAIDGANNKDVSNLAWLDILTLLNAGSPVSLHCSLFSSVASGKWPLQYDSKSGYKNTKVALKLRKFKFLARNQHGRTQ